MKKFWSNEYQVFHILQILKSIHKEELIELLNENKESQNQLRRGLKGADDQVLPFAKTGNTETINFSIFESGRTRWGHFVGFLFATKKNIPK